MAKGYVKEFTGLDELKTFLGADPDLSKVVVIDKAMPEGTIRHRAILDYKSRCVSGASCKTEYTVLDETEIDHEWKKNPTTIVKLN